MNKKELTKLLHKKYHGLFRDTLVSHSFKRYKTNNYVRITRDDIIQSINIQKHSWDTEFTFNLTVFPLFFESEFMYFAFGGIRGGKFKNGTDFWWKYANEEQMDSSLQDSLDLFESKILPFFDNIRDSKSLFNYLNSANNLFESYKYHPMDHKNNIGLLMARMGDTDNAIKFIDSNILSQIRMYDSFNTYLEKIINSGYEKFNIDKEKYKLKISDKD